MIEQSAGSEKWRHGDCKHARTLAQARLASQCITERSPCLVLRCQQGWSRRLRKLTKLLALGDPRKDGRE